MKKLKLLGISIVFFGAGVLAAEAYDYNGHEYHLTGSGTWAQAEAEAVSMGGHLVSINDADEQTFINGLLSGSTWIGLNDEGTEVWAWINGDPVTFTNWSTYEPNGGPNENCGVSEQAWGGLWNDLPCDRLHRGIVEIDPLGPSFVCVGFEPPMAGGPVKVKRDRALPLKAEIFDADGFAVTDIDVSTPPVVQVWYEFGTSDEDLIEVDALPAGVGDDGNQFVFTAEDRWQFNLKTGSYTAPGTYTVFMESGDTAEYMLETPTCTAEFVVR